MLTLTLFYTVVHKGYCRKNAYIYTVYISSRCTEFACTNVQHCGPAGLCSKSQLDYFEGDAMAAPQVPPPRCPLSARAATKKSLSAT